MVSIRKFIILLSVCGINFVATASFNFTAHWEDDFSKSEQDHLVKWIQTVGNAVEQTLGTYPFTVQVYFHRSNKTNEPVPWAHTSREGEEAVHFHVNPSFSFDELYHDWTAAHEISHLSLPYIGNNYSWFAEGYASYFQWQIMYTQGILTKEQLDEKMLLKVAEIIPKYDSAQPFTTVAKHLRLRFDFPSYYYGGACYFIQIDQKLRSEKSTTLTKIISDYLKNGRLITENLSEVIQQLDVLSGSSIFTKTMNTFETEPAIESIGKTIYFAQ